MKKAAIIKDSFRNMPHLVVFGDEKEFKSIAITEFGKQIAEQAISGSFLNTKSLPDGFVSTGFKNISPEMQSFIEKNIAGISEENNDQVYMKVLAGKKLNPSPTRVVNPQKVAIYGMSEKSMASFSLGKDKENIVDFKAKMFCNKIKTSSIIGSIKSGRIGMDCKNMEVTSRDSIPLSELTADLVKSYIAQGLLRRTFSPHVKGLKIEKSRRVERRVKSLNAGRIPHPPTATVQRIYVSPLSRLKNHV